MFEFFFKLSQLQALVKLLLVIGPKTVKVCNGLFQLYQQPCKTLINTIQYTHTM